MVTASSVINTLFIVAPLYGKSSTYSFDNKEKRAMPCGMSPVFGGWKHKKATRERVAFSLIPQILGRVP
jgi:hypothetical protein